MAMSSQNFRSSISGSLCSWVGASTLLRLFCLFGATEPLALTATSGVRKQARYGGQAGVRACRAPAVLLIRDHFTKWWQVLNQKFDQPGIGAKHGLLNFELDTGALKLGFQLIEALFTCVGHAACDLVHLHIDIGHVDIPHLGRV